MHNKGMSEIASRVAEKLRQAVSRAKAQNAENLSTFEWSEQQLKRHSCVIQELIQHLASIVAEMDPPPRRLSELAPGEFWSVGCEDIRFPVREIHGGYVEPVLRRPLVRQIPPNVVAFLIALPWYDFLEREHGGHIGWHYHYLNWKKERSNVVLCWDARAQTNHQNETHPMYQEKHGEGRYRFAARPDLWGPEKCFTMHNKCFPDLKKWPLDAFRCASSDAELVWPAGASPRPIPNPASKPAADTAKMQRAKNKRR